MKSVDDIPIIRKEWRYTTSKGYQQQILIDRNDVESLIQGAIEEIFKCNPCGGTGWIERKRGKVFCPWCNKRGHHKTLGKAIQSKNLNDSTKKEVISLLGTSKEEKP